MSIDNSKTKAYWDASSDDYFERCDNESVIRKIIENPAFAFPQSTYEIIQKCFPDLKGKKICVPSSGDNTAVFAFHLMGAQVTSVDISSKQIKNAHAIACQHSWDIEFICQDSMDLHDLNGGEYDLVYTSNGVHVWISDLKAMYDHFSRILKDNGYYILFETHPVIRPFDDNQAIMTVKRVFEDIGPFGDVPNYCWRMQDFINSLIQAGFTVRQLEEFHPLIGDLNSWWYRTEEDASKDNNDKFDWIQNPWAALPQWFSVCTQKL